METPYLEVQQAIGKMSGGGGSPIWKNILGKTAITVSPIGLGTSGVTIANNGADYGPDTPGTTTSGIQEALNAVSALGGGTVYLAATANVAFSITSSLTIPSGVRLESAAWSGEGYTIANGQVVFASSSLITYGGASGAIDVILVSGVAASGMAGITVEASVAVRSLIRVSGSRSIHLHSCSTLGIAGQIGILVDGETQNCEHNVYSNCFFQGDPAIQIGIAGEAQHSNDSTWADITAEGPGLAVGPTDHVIYVATQGGNHRFRNLYSRGSASSAQILIDMSVATGGQLELVGGEIQFGDSTHTVPAVLANVGGGTLTLASLSITLGNLTQSTGRVNYNGVTIQTNLHTYSISGGIMRADRFCTVDIGKFAWAKTGGTFVIPAGSDSNSWGALDVYAAGSSSIPTVVATAAPASGVWVKPSVDSASLVIFPAKAVAATDTFQADISPDGGVTILPQTPSMAGNVAGDSFPLWIFVPTGWSYRIVLTGTATLLAGSTSKIAMD